MDLSTELLWKYAGEAMEAMFSTCPGFTFEHGEFGWFMATGEPIADFNCAFVAPRTGEVKRLEKYVDRFGKLRCPFLICAPQAIALKLHLPARKAGLSSIGELPLMTIRPPAFHLPSPNPSVTVSKIETLEELSAAVAIGSISFGIRPDVLAKVVNLRTLENDRLSMYLAYLDETPAGIVTITSHDDAIGIWSMVTAPDSRRKGVASRLVDHVLGETDASNCFLLATDEGRPLYEKLGFRIQATGQVWCGGVTR